jgi:nitrite reductase/ring-hydroxylating ferredoxin subunit
MTAVSIDGQYVLLINIDDVVRAYADACPHKRTRLSQGSLQGCILINGSSMLLPGAGSTL